MATNPFLVAGQRNFANAGGPHGQVMYGTPIPAPATPLPLPPTQVGMVPGVPGSMGLSPNANPMLAAANGTQGQGQDVRIHQPGTEFNHQSWIDAMTNWQNQRRGAVQDLAAPGPGHEVDRQGMRRSYDATRPQRANFYTPIPTA